MKKMAPDQGIAGDAFPLAALMDKTYHAGA
jgi:hypothetical protein